MSIRVRDVLMRELGGLRYEPTDKRIRGVLGDATVVDSTRALLVWEPRRIVPTYAVPAGDIAGDLQPAAAEAAPEVEGVSLGERKVLDPSIPFTVHTAEGRPVTVRADGREVAGFVAADDALTGHVLLDF